MVKTESGTMRSMVVAIAAILGSFASDASSGAAEKFQKLSGSQIRAKFVGMEMTDNVHWADVYGLRRTNFAWIAGPMMEVAIKYGSPERTSS
jgi:hypothetical protein